MIVAARDHMQLGVWRRIAAISSLAVLSPVITNVHFGAIRITSIVALLPAAGAWGIGSVLIREVARRRGLGWISILILGMAIALAEECVFLQTSFYPLIGIDPSRVYGRLFGVNWPYLLWSLGYESVWAVVIPILLVEWSFPACRQTSWCGRVGLSVLACIFVGAGIVRWYGWTQVFIPQFFPASAQGPSSPQVALALLIVFTIALVALRVPTPGRRDSATRAIPTPWLMALASCGCGLLWFGLLFLSYGVAPNMSVSLSLILGLLLAAGSLVIVLTWATHPSFGETHALALVAGALTASMLAGFLVLRGSYAPTVDYVGKGVVNGLIMTALIWLSRKLRPASQVRVAHP